MIPFACIIISIKLSFSIGIRNTYTPFVCSLSCCHMCMKVSKKESGHVSFDIKMLFEWCCCCWFRIHIIVASDIFALKYDNFAIHPAGHFDYCAQYRIVHRYRWYTQLSAQTTKLQIKSFRFPRISNAAFHWNDGKHLQVFQFVLVVAVFFCIHSDNERKEGKWNHWIIIAYLILLTFK